MRPTTPSIADLLHHRSIAHNYGPSKVGLYNAALRQGDSTFRYSRELRGHLSCINATNFSHGDAKYLVSGGDDKRVLIWDAYDRPDVAKPLKTFRGHQSNIFCTVFDSSNRHIVSCGNDCLILRFDIEYSSEHRDRIVDATQKPGKADEIILGHDGSVQAVDLCPINDSVMLSASQDGTIRLWDYRISTKNCQGVIVGTTEVSCVKFNPVMEHLFVSSDARGRVVLRDMRTAFASVFHGHTATDAKRFVLVDYTTSLSRAHQTSIPDISSVTFNRAGTLLAATIQRYLPTIYSIFDEMPVCTLAAPVSSPKLTEGVGKLGRNEGFKNSCTMKHGHFGGPEDSYFLSGSDDFCVYAWKIPDLENMLAERRIQGRRWTSATAQIVFNNCGTRVKPMENDTPAFVLKGHRSIVNSAIWHPHMPLIFSSGVEKVMRVHSPFPWGEQDITAASSYRPRPRLPLNRRMRRYFLENPNFSCVLGIDSDANEPWDNDNEGQDAAGPHRLFIRELAEEDAKTIALFDVLLAEEARVDPLWDLAETDESDDGDDDDDDSESSDEELYAEINVGINNSSGGLGSPTDSDEFLDEFYHDMQSPRNFGRMINVNDVGDAVSDMSTTDSDTGRYE